MCVFNNVSATTLLRLSLSCNEAYFLLFGIRNIRLRLTWVTHKLYSIRSPITLLSVTNFSFQPYQELRQWKINIRDILSTDAFHLQHRILFYDDNPIMLVIAVFRH